MARTLSRPDRGPDASGALAAVRTILSQPVTALDYAEAKLALDRIVDPSLDDAAALGDLERMAEGARRLAGGDDSLGARFAALRRFVYDAGPWNGHRPFAYDHSDPPGTNIPNKLLAHYLRTRRGNCVSMPILLLILADKLGFDAALASAPHHVFLRVRDERGRAVNIEATSGGHPARDSWYRRNFPMSNRALASGLYMRTLSRRESVALMASTMVEHLLHEHRYEEAIAVSNLILEHNPRDGQIMVAQASAYGALMEMEFARKYPVSFLIPEPRRPRYWLLCERNQSLFAAAEALGWEPDPAFA